MTRILVTGASGYIGSRLCEIACRRGLEIVVLGNSPLAGTIVGSFDWQLGDDPPASSLSGVTAVVHLAHSWASDREAGDSPNNVNLLGTEKLARQALAAGVPKFVFASTVSSRLDALNSYGRIKNSIEQRLRSLPNSERWLLIARLGLVYGGPERGQYGLLSKLVRTAPILPMIGLERQVQPIHLDDVVAGLLMLATTPVRGPESDVANTFILAAATPCSFGQWLRTLRNLHTGKRLSLIPIPMWTALLACDVSRLLPFVPHVDRERVLGLAGTVPMDSSPSLAALGLKLVDPDERLASLPWKSRAIAAEAAAMLCYVSGRVSAPQAAVLRLIHGVKRQSNQPLALPEIFLRCPALLRIVDPVMPRGPHRLAQRLHLAVMVMESTPTSGQRRFGLVNLILQSVLDIIALPFRLLFGRAYK